MFIDVKLLSGFTKPLTYTIPSSFGVLPVGTIVKVPVRTTVVPALVVACYATKKESLFTLKECLSVEAFPKDPHYMTFITALARYHLTDPVYFIARIRSFIEQKESDDAPIIEERFIPNTVQLTQEQQAVVHYLQPKITQQVYAPTLLHGVTGSGKTEVYKKLIEHAYQEGKTTILLLPEVTLATQFEKILKVQLPDLPIISFHSASSAKTKRNLWQSLQDGKPQLIIGVHLPVLLPVENLGLIIIDEEHEVGFQEKKHPKINTKSAAVMRAQQYNIPILMGSATPSITSLYNVETRGWVLFKLTTRFGGAFPTIKHVLLPDQKQRKNFWISTELYNGIKEQLLKKEQTIIFLNRRGICFFLQCKECAHIFECKFCSVSLTLHGDNMLKCHYCSYLQQAPEVCPKCTKKEFLKKGIGTQQIVTILEKLFPTARIARADMDTTTNKKVWQNTITDFEQEGLDILVGTQTITKGFHFPKVTLVGVIWADVNLNFPIYNAKEVVLQQLIQVAGRAGRCSLNGRVILQSMTDSPLFKYINELDYLKFYDHEIINRKLIGYPPALRFAELELKHKKEEVAEQEAFLVASLLLKQPNLRVLGPAQPPVSKIKRVFSRKIYIKADRFEQLTSAFKALEHLKLKSELFFTPQPLS
jgi:primosomal protein N' (replication factor Y)